MKLMNPKSSKKLTFSIRKDFMSSNTNNNRQWAKKYTFRTCFKPYLIFFYKKFEF